MTHAHATGDAPDAISALISPAGLPAIPPLAARPALRRRLPYRDFFPDIPSVLPDFLGNAQDLCAELLGVRDLDPRAVAEHDHAERGPHPILIFDE